MTDYTSRWPVALTALLCFFANRSVAAQEWIADEDGFQQHAVSVFSQFCLECHGPELQEGQFRVDTMLTAEMSDQAVISKWSEVVDVLNSHQMPPEDAPQPNANDVAALVDWVTTESKRAAQFNRSTDVVLRRLNRAEYRNTIRDLIGIDYDVSMFPEDASAGGFDNNGAALSVSPMQVEIYLRAAREILDQAIVTGEAPPSIRWRFEPESGDSDSNRVRYGNNNAIVNGGQNPVLGEGRLITHDQWNKKINARDFKVDIAGPYVIRMRVGGVTPSPTETREKLKELFQAEFERRMTEKPEDARGHRHNLERGLEHAAESWIYRYGPPRIRVTVHQGGQPEVIGEVDVIGGVDADSTQTIEMPVQMGTETSGITLQNSYTLRRVLENISIYGDEAFPRPALFVDWFEIEGPVYDSWPPPSHQRLLPDPIPPTADEQRLYAQSVLRRFMTAAYRRDVSDEEVAGKLRLFEMTRQQTRDFTESIKSALTAVLVSPNFLFLADAPSVENASDRLTDPELASRLSYFLWSSMPDETLMTLARQGKLSDREVRLEQVDRMLADPKSNALAENFAAQWLGLRAIGSNPPAEDLFPRYDDHLEESLARESKAFFIEVLRADLPVTSFIDSDFSMLNERLARYYEIDGGESDGVRGDHMRRVTIASNSHRGGVITQASVLTITSNGTRTTPVRRGTWILKTLLNADPGLPVANAGEIAPKVPGIDKATVRQRLAIHRELPQCARCHDRIDPLGFALENYDAAGRWRTQEGFGYQGRVNEDDPVIDASGELPDGTQIDGIDGLKQALLTRRDELHRGLTEKLFAYALGREMTLVDSTEINEIVDLLSQQPDTLRTMIRGIVTSDTFEKR